MKALLLRTLNVSVVFHPFLIMFRIAKIVIELKSVMGVGMLLNPLYYYSFCVRAYLFKDQTSLQNHFFIFVSVINRQIPTFVRYSYFTISSEV